MHQQFINFERAYDSVRREVSYNILIGSGIRMQLVLLIKMSVNETCSTCRVGKHLLDMSFINNCLKQGDALLPLLFNIALE